MSYPSPPPDRRSCGRLEAKFSAPGPGNPRRSLQEAERSLHARSPRRLQGPPKSSEPRPGHPAARPGRHFRPAVSGQGRGGPAHPARHRHPLSTARLQLPGRHPFRRCMGFVLMDGVIKAHLGTTDRAKIEGEGTWLNDQGERPPLASTVERRRAIRAGCQHRAEQRGGGSPRPSGSALVGSSISSASAYCLHCCRLSELTPLRPSAFARKTNA